MRRADPHLQMPSCLWRPQHQDETLRYTSHVFCPTTATMHRYQVLNHNLSGPSGNPPFFLSSSSHLPFSAHSFTRSPQGLEHVRTVSKSSRYTICHAIPRGRVAAGPDGEVFIGKEQNRVPRARIFSTCSSSSSSSS